VKKGGTTTTSPINERGGPRLIVDMNPIHYGMWSTIHFTSNGGRVFTLGYFVSGQKTFTSSGVRGHHGLVT
jgi:hypothetical protein